MFNTDPTIFCSQTKVQPRRAEREAEVGATGGHTVGFIRGRRQMFRRLPSTCKENLLSIHGPPASIVILFITDHNLAYAADIKEPARTGAALKASAVLIIIFIAFHQSS